MLLGRRIDINDSRFVMASLDHVVHRVTVLRDLVSTLLSSKEVSRHLISVTGNRTSFGIGTQDCQRILVTYRIATNVLPSVIVRDGVGRCCPVSSVACSMV